MAEKERKKKNRSEEFLPQKIPKKQKTLLWLLFEAKYVGEGREREKISWERLSKREKKKKKSFQ